MCRLRLCWLLCLLAVVWCAPVLAQTDVGGVDSNAVPPPDSIPYKQRPAVEEGSLTRIALVFVLAIGLCVLVIYALRTVLQRRGMLATVAGQRITVVESKRLTPKLTTFLLAIDEREYLLVQNGDQVQLIHHDGGADHAGGP